MAEPSAVELRNWLEYDPATGVVSWKVRADRDAAWNGRFADCAAGCIDTNGYLKIRLNNVGLMYHRVAWSLANGDIPVGMQIDHKNRNRQDNRLSNLRLATHSQNGANKASPANTIYKRGVGWDSEKKKFRARIRVLGRRIELGRYDTEDAAHQAYVAAAHRYYGEFASVR